MTTAQTVSPRGEIAHLRVTVAHHVDNEFYDLARVMPTSGGAMIDWNGALIADVTHEVPPAILFEAIEDAPCPKVDGCSTHPEMCVILDACNANGDVIDDREISIEDANRLLDGEFAKRLAAARGNLAVYYASSSPSGPREVR
jgi:hypothetical protein